MERSSVTKSNMRTPEEKGKIVLEYLNGRVGYKSVARSYGLSYGCFFVWI